MCFTDYTTDMKKVGHEEIIKMLENVYIDGKDLIIRKPYGWLRAAIQIANQMGTLQHIKHGC